MQVKLKNIMFSVVNKIETYVLLSGSFLFQIQSSVLKMSSHVPMVRPVFLNLIAAITSMTVETIVMKLMGVFVTQSLTSSVSVVVVSMPLGGVMVNQIVMMAVMNLIALNALKEHTNVPMETVFLKSSSVIISMTVGTTVMKLMAVSVTFPMSLNVLLVDASMVHGFVMVNQIVLMAVMKLKTCVANQQKLQVRTDYKYML